MEEHFMKKLQTRMLLFILVPTLLFFIGTISFVSFTVQNIAKKDAEEMLVAHGESLANELRLEMEKPLKAVETLSNSFKGVIEGGTVPRRESANNMLKQVLENNPHVLTAWMFWEENAFDGNDEEYVNTIGHDNTGRFIPVWSQTESGEFNVDPVIDYDVPGSDVYDNINNVLETGENSIFEPFYYEVDGEDVLITSIVAPVKVNGKIIGMTGVDISLHILDEYISEFSFYNTGFAGLMSNMGTVISHNNDELIGENYFETDAVKKNKDIRQVSEAVNKGESARIEGFSNALQTDVYRLFTPINVSGVQTPWSAFLAAPIDQVMKDAKNLTISIISISLVVIIILAIIILFVTRTIVGPIHKVVEHGKEMANGNFSRKNDKKDIKRKDEIGELEFIFN